VHWRDRIGNQPGKQNVPPFRGGTWQAFYAGGDKCQPVVASRPVFIRAVEMANCGG
jgi:hypothetical protein